MHKISIVTTVWNVAKYLEQSIDSALNQTYENVEIILVEDCSTDLGKTQSIVCSYEERYPDKIKVVWNNENVGPGMSRRIGIQNSTGEYVLLLDGDDWLTSDFLKDLVTGGDNADIISGGITVHRENGDVDMTIYKGKEETGVNKIKGHFLERIIFMNNKLIRRSLYDKVPYCGRRYIEDTPTIVPLMYYADRVKYVESPGYNYRMRKGSLTHETTVVKNALFRGLCMMDLIEWAKDKPREYRDLFKRTLIISLGNELRRQPPEELQKAANQWPEEWRQFANYLNYTEELRDSFK